MALLETGEMCIGDLALALEASEDAASYALRLLRTAGLVVRRTQGRMGYYRLQDGATGDAIAEVLERLRTLVQLHPEREPEDRA